jgi:3-oxoacyl-[acyl-carrier protein] reductase
MAKIIVTGASRGIGLEAVRFLLEEGHEVVAISRTESPLQGADLPLLRSVCIDLADSDFESLHEVIKDWSHVDALIHNAGAFLNKPFSETSVEDFEFIYRVNVFGVARLTQALAGKLVRGSHVLGISSMGGIQGSAKFPGLSAYSSSKGALITLFELLAEEYKDAGVAFNTLALGAVNTEMLAKAFPDFVANVSAQQMGEYVAKFALTGHELYNGKVLQVSNSTP